MTKVQIDADLYHRFEAAIERHRKQREEHTKECCWECLRVKQSPRWIPFCSKKCSRTFWARSQLEDANRSLSRPTRTRKVKVLA